MMQTTATLGVSLGIACFALTSSIAFVAGVAPLASAVVNCGVSFRSPGDFGINTDEFILSPCQICSDEAFI